MSRFDTRWATPGFLAFAFLYLFLTLFLVTGTPIFFENDHFLQMYDSVRMLEGERIYKDFFQFTFPGTEVWYLILFSVFGQKLWLLNATILLLGFSLAWTILAMSRRLMTGAFVYVAPTLFLFFGFRWFGMDGGHRLFSCLFASLAILILLKEISLPRLAAAGGLAAMSAFFTQTRGLAVFAGIGIFLLFYYITAKSGERVKGFLGSSLIIGLAFSLSLAALLGYFLASVGISEFLQSTIFFGQSYASDPVNNSNLYFLFWRQLFSGSFDLISLPVALFYYLLVPVVYLIPPVYYLLKRPAERQVWSKVMLLCFAGFMMFLATTGLNAVRLYHVAIPGLVLIAYWWSTLDLKNVFLAGTAAAALFAIALCGWGQIKNYPARLDMPTGTAVFQSEIAAEKYAWVNENTEPDDVVFESYRTIVNFPLKVRNPASVPMLRNTNYTSPTEIARLIEELKQNPPKYILWNAAWSEKPTPRAADDHLQPMFEYLTANYRLAKKMTPIYEVEIEAWERKQ